VESVIIEIERLVADEIQKEFDSPAVAFFLVTSPDTLETGNEPGHNW